jgi:hypothetical protein
MESTKREDATTTTRESDGVKESEMKNKSMWNNEAVKAYESGQGVVLVEKPYSHYEPKDGGWTSERVAGMARLKTQQEAKLKEKNT